MSRQPKLRPKSHIPGFPDAIYGLTTMSSLSQLEPRAGLGEEKPEQRVFRVKRKHVLKACDRCRVKKTKCDGKQPCNRCSAYNHPCLFRERKATQTKVYSRGFVEMLESHHSLVVKALQRLYKLCISKEGFPGELLVESTDGYPLTHAILDRLGLIKQAEENIEETEEDTDDIQYLRFLSTSTDCSATTDPSPEPATPPNPSPTTCNPPHISPKGNSPWKWEFQPVRPIQPEQYHGYPPPGFPGMMPPRPALGSMRISDAVKCPEVGPSPSTNQDHPYQYYSGGKRSEEQNAHNNTIHTDVATEPGSFSTVTATGVPVDMLSDYSVHLHEPQPLYPSLATGWTYACG